MAMPPPTSPSSALKRPSPPASPAKSPAAITARVAKQGSPASTTSPKRAKTNNKNGTPQGNTMLAYFTVAASPSSEKPTAT
jgi:hypothetical protein